MSSEDVIKNAIEAIRRHSRAAGMRESARIAKERLARIVGNDPYADGLRVAYELVMTDSLTRAAAIERGEP